MLGATSLVGQALLPLLAGRGCRVIAFSRRVPSNEGAFEFRQISRADNAHHGEEISDWIVLAPIWTLKENMKLLSGYGAKRIVALSSTSRFTKQGSSDASERQTAEKLLEGEREFATWAEAYDIEWVILRPTLIYGMGQDRNLSEVARFISRFGYFPLLGKASGLRQPVHAADVAEASMAALWARRVRNRAYQLSGAEVLSYRKMVAKVFAVMGKPERFIPVPKTLFRLAITCLRILPRFRHWNVAMAERMDTDMIFSHGKATRDFGYKPCAFSLEETDLPEPCRSKDHRS